MKKRLFSLLCSSVLMLSICAPAFANDTNVLSEVIVDLPRQEMTFSEPSNRAHDVDYKRELSDTATVTKQYIGPAGGQPSNGTVFASNGGFYWSDGGNSVLSSFSVYFGTFSLNLSPGSVGGSGGAWISSPYVNTPCKLFIYKDLTAEKYNIYSRLTGTTNWMFDHSEYNSYPSRDYFIVERV